MTETPTAPPPATAPLRLTPAQYEFLLRGIHQNRVSRTPQGQSHLEQWDIRRTLTQVFGFGGWEVTTKRLWMIRELEVPPGTITQTKWVDNVKRQVLNEKTLWTVVYGAEVRLTIKNADGTIGAVYEDGATGDSQNQPSIGDAHDQAMKTALSQAVKRCAVNLGDQFGLSLYNRGNLNPVVISTALPPATADAPAADLTHEPDPVQGETPATTAEEDYAPPVGGGEPPAEQPANGYTAQGVVAPPHGKPLDRPAPPPATAQREPGETAAQAAIRQRHAEDAARYPRANGNGNGNGQAPERPRPPRDDHEAAGLVEAILSATDIDALRSLWRQGEKLAPAGLHTDIQHAISPAALAVLPGLEPGGPLVLGRLLSAAATHLEQEAYSVADHVRAEEQFAAEHPATAPA